MSSPRKLRDPNRTPVLKRTRIHNAHKVHKAHKAHKIHKASATPAPLRQPWLDALRGVAVLAMIAYHFGFDLNFIGWLHQDLEHDLRWQIARWLILGCFLFSVGASHTLAVMQHSSRHKQVRRILKITLAALLVTAGSHLIFPASTIWFGTLHAIAVMSLLLLGAHQLRLGTTLLLLIALLVLVTGNLVSHPLFDTPALAWIGLMTHAPFTEDYVPLLPWFSVCLAGTVFMQWHLQQQRSALTLMPHFAIPSRLRWIGRHSLAIYLLHQPILLGILIPLSKVGPSA